jgi:hypothetical protein
LILPALAIFAVVSLKTGINDHMRYVLPSFPYLIIFASQIVRVGYLTRQVHVISSRPRGNLLALLPIFVVASLAWLCTSSASLYPHGLSYFNESIGGPLNGYKHLLGSSLDWGQDLRYLQSAGFGNATISKTAIGFLPTQRLQLPSEEKSSLVSIDAWTSDLSALSSSSNNMTPVKWLAVSCNAWSPEVLPWLGKPLTMHPTWHRLLPLHLLPPRRITYSYFVYRLPTVSSSSTWRSVDNAD